MAPASLTFLGSSSGMPSPTRFCSSLLLQTERINLLVDCGEGVSFSLLKYKIDPLLVDSIFVSHSHVDHLGGLFLLVQLMYLLRRGRSLNVYLPEEAIPGVKQFLGTCYLFPEKLNFGLSLLPITPGFEFEAQDVSLKAHSNRHLTANQTAIEDLGLDNRMQSFSFILGLPGKKIVYSGDIQSAGDLAEIAAGADILITECMHPDLRELLFLVADKGVKSTIFTHIPPELEDRQKEILEMAPKVGLGRLSFASDGLRISL
jgi:ribonuclease BN (tRNA processing enzyme)